MTRPSSPRAPSATRRSSAQARQAPRWRRRRVPVLRRPEEAPEDGRGAGRRRGGASTARTSRSEARDDDCAPSPRSRRPAARDKMIIFGGNKASRPDRGRADPRARVRGHRLLPLRRRHLARMSEPRAAPVQGGAARRGPAHDGPDVRSRFEHYGGARLCTNQRRRAGVASMTRREHSTYAQANHVLVVDRWFNPTRPGHGPHAPLRPEEAVEVTFPTARTRSTRSCASSTSTSRRTPRSRRRTRATCRGSRRRRSRGRCSAASSRTRSRRSSTRAAEKMGITRLLATTYDNAGAGHGRRQPVPFD